MALKLNEGSPYGRRIAEIRGEIPESSTPSFAAYSAEYLKRRALRHPASQARTEQTVRDHLLPRFGKFPLDQISYAAVEDWCIERLNTEGIAHSNVQRELAVLNAVLNDAVKRGVIATHQARYTLPRNREAEVIRVLSPDQIRAVFDASNPEHRAIWQLMVNTGLRRGEAMEANHADISTTMKYVHPSDDLAAVTAAVNIG